MMVVASAIDLTLVIEILAVIALILVILWLLRRS
jgi:flagellar biogenesis protein FliO